MYIRGPARSSHQVNGWIALTLAFTCGQLALASIPNYQNGFELYSNNDLNQDNQSAGSGANNRSHLYTDPSCANGLLTFELATGFIYKPSSAETLAMMPSTLQLTDCLDYCIHNESCQAINFEMGLCVLLSSSARQNPASLFSSQFPVFTIYAEKKCLLSGDRAGPKRRRCQRAWTFERVAGYEMRTKPRRRLQLATRDQCMEACLGERDFECRSANWYRKSGDCTLSDQDRHSVSQSEASDQQIIKSSLHDLYGPVNRTGGSSALFDDKLVSSSSQQLPMSTPTGGLYQNYYLNPGFLQNFLQRQSNDSSAPDDIAASPRAYSNNTNPNEQSAPTNPRHKQFRQLFGSMDKILKRLLTEQAATAAADESNETLARRSSAAIGMNHYAMVPELPAEASVDYLENNCVYEPNKLCEFRKIQNKVLKTVDSIYQDVASLEECKQRCLNAPYRCYSFDYGDTAERVCRTSHLDQASLLSVREPYLDVVGAITYELASCFNVSIQCKAREMVAQVSASKMFRGKIYAKTRPNSCANDVKESLKFELSMKYHDEACDVRSSSNSQQGVFSNDIVIQHHDRIVTTQDIGLSVYCQYDLGNRSITNNVDLAIERIEDPKIESKTKPAGLHVQSPSTSTNGGDGTINSPLTITSLATTVVRSPNVTMRITNMNGQPVQSATVGDRLALMFEIKEKSSPFGIFIREIIAMDGKQVFGSRNKTSLHHPLAGTYHYATTTMTSLIDSQATPPVDEGTLESLIQANRATSVQMLDSNGCPTDANIMGPLVRMDPAGHRILAPFDAFKFPTSDMVFFRAVVTSCINECKLNHCNRDSAGTTLSTDEGSSEGNGGLSTYLDPSTLASSLTTASANRTSPPTTPTTQAPITSTSVSPTTRSVQQMSSKYTQPATLSPTTDARMSTRGNGDSLTTIPGFSSEQQGAGEHLITNNQTNSDTSVNVTSNHFGKAPPRPQPGDNRLTGANQGVNLPKIKLDAFSSQQRQQIIQQFEHASTGSKSKQHQQQNELATNNGSISEMAELFSGFLIPIMIGNGANPTSSNPSSSSLSSQTEGAADSASDNPDDPRNKSWNRASPTATAIDQQHPTTSSDFDLQAMASDNSLRNESAPSSNVTSKGVRLADFAGFLKYLLDRDRLGIAKEPIGDSDGESVVINDSHGLADLSGSGSQGENQTTTAMKQNQQMQAAKMASNKKKNLQSLADSYMGALQGKRKRRSIQFDDDISSLKSEIHNLPGASFTRAIVEAYQHEPLLARTKRDTGDSPPVAYDMDEMIVQSIRIVDKLEFKDEQKRLQRQDSRNTNSTSKSQDVRTPRPLPNARSTKRVEQDDESRQQARDSNIEQSFLSSSSGLVLLMLATCFVFVQLFLVTLWLLDWKWQKKCARQNRQRQIMSAQASNFDPSISDQFGSDRTSPAVSLSLSHSNSALNYHHHLHSDLAPFWSPSSQRASLSHSPNSQSFVPFVQAKPGPTIVSTGNWFKANSIVRGRRERGTMLSNR